MRALTDRAAAVAEFICRNVQELNGTPEDPHSYDRLDKLLDAQVYRLSHWKAAADEINYRRFFDINELAAVCMEAPEVFAESHRLVFELLVRGDVNGLRVDHIDGLYDPTEYLRRLQRGYLVALGKALYQLRRRTGQPASRLATAAPAGDLPPPWSDIEPAFLPSVTEMTCTDRATLPLYVVVEKILGSRGNPARRLVAGGHDGLRFSELRGRVVRRPVRGWPNWPTSIAASSTSGSISARWRSSRSG